MAYTAELKKNFIWFHLGRNTSKSVTARFYDNTQDKFDANYSSRAFSKVGKVAFMITSKQKRVLQNMAHHPPGRPSSRHLPHPP